MRQLGFAGRHMRHCSVGFRNRMSQPREQRLRDLGGALFHHEVVGVEQHRFHVVESQRVEHSRQAFDLAVVVTAQPGTLRIIEQ